MEDKTAFKIVERIIEDLTDRRGLGQEWDQIESSVRAEIKDTWVRIASNAIKDGV